MFKIVHEATGNIVATDKAVAEAWVKAVDRVDEIHGYRAICTECGSDGQTCNWPTGLVGKAPPCQDWANKI